MGYRLGQSYIKLQLRECDSFCNIWIWGDLESFPLAMAPFGYVNFQTDYIILTLVPHKVNFWITSLVFKPQIY